MTEFQWKNNFINQDKLTQHINKYELLLTILKVKNKSTSKLEENTESLIVQDFSIYEEFLIEHVLPKSKTLDKQSKLLHNQPVFKDIIKNIKVDTPLKIDLKSKRQIFAKFSKYVNLKDIKNKNKNYYRFAYGCQIFFILCILVYLLHVLWPLLLFGLFVLKSLVLFLAYKFDTNSFFFNRIKIDNELCLIELQKEFVELEKLLNVSQDPYKDDSFEEAYEKFQNIFSIPKKFLEICLNNNVIDDYNIVSPKHNHNLIQYLKLRRNENFRNENFDWQLINHVIIFDIKKSKKSDFLKADFKKDPKTGDYYSKEGIKFKEFIKLFD